MPKRIQRKRTKGWKMPPNTVYVGRPTKWGNPWTAGKTGTRSEIVERYRRALGRNLSTFPSLEEIRRELRGKYLACWCPLVDKDGKPVPCHADILLAIANDWELPNG